MSCNHERQIQKQTSVLVDGKWEKSSLEWLCLDCNARGINTQKYAFLADDIQRKTEITRDDMAQGEKA